MKKHKRLSDIPPKTYFLIGLFVGLVFTIGFFMQKYQFATYRSQVFNFSFQYPRGLIVTSHEDSAQTVMNGQISPIYINSSNLDTTYRILVFAEKKDTKNNKELINAWVNYPSTRYDQDINYTETSINGLTAYKLKATPNTENFKESALIIAPEFVYTFKLHEPSDSVVGEQVLEKVLESIRINYED